MSGDPFDHPDWRKYAKRVEAELVPKIRNSAASLSLWDDQVDPKLAIETGYAVLMDKPMIILCPRGAHIPAKFRAVADKIIEYDDLDDEATGKAIAEAMAEILGGEHE